MRFAVCGLGFKVWSSGFRLSCLGYRFKREDCRAEGLGHDLEFRVQGSGCPVVMPLCVVRRIKGFIKQRAGDSGANVFLTAM